MWQGWDVEPNKRHGGVKSEAIMNGLILFFEALNLMELDLLPGEQVG